jgi:hypothetical protein
MSILRRTFVLFAAAAVWALAAGAQPAPRVTSPIQEFGFEIGSDYNLATYAQFENYIRKLDLESDRMKVVSIGKTAEGRDQPMAIITAPENFAKLERYREISQRLARAEGLTEDQARALAREGKAVVWIDGGLHASETLGAQQLIETIYQLVSRNDEETRRILRDVIVLCVHANPDGHVMVADPFMSEPEPKKRRFVLPRLYQKYVGHDNNRDFYMVTQAETNNMVRQLFQEWFPQIMYNHHQSGPRGTVMAAPPYRDPFSYFFDPGIPVGLNLVAAAIHNRLTAEGKPGFTFDMGSSFSFWYNGGLRTITYFHNMIGILTETIGSPIPMEIPFVPDRLLPNSDQPYPVHPQKWPFRRSVDYSVTANYAVLDVASRYREELLTNIWRMGRNSIERGSQDHWTITPSRIERVKAEASRSGTARSEEGRRGGAGQVSLPEKHYELLRQPADRDPRGYILPADQPDFPTATKFINTFIKLGVVVHRATAAFEVNGKQYPAGSYVVKTAQAFRPHVLDMFEPQDYPNDIPYPGGPPTPPYDLAGWTLAYQMGVKFDRILEAFDGPFERINTLVKPPAGMISGTAAPAGYLVGHEANDAVLAVNRLLKQGERVFWLKEAVTADGKSFPAGAFYIPAKASTRAELAQIAAETGVSAHGVAARPGVEAGEMKKLRVALWDRYGGSMSSGWIRWLLEQYDFEFDVVYPAKLDEGDLRAQYDVIVLPDGALGGGGAVGLGFGSGGSDTVPDRYKFMAGRITAEKTLPKLREFVESGGTILALGSSSRLAEQMKLPVQNHLVERTSSGQERPLPREKFYVPGSVLSAKVDTTHPLAHGMGERVDLTFSSSPTYRLTPEAPASRLRPVVWFDSAKPLRSGWAWGQQYLEGGVAVFEANVGEGTLVGFGPEVTFRAQTHGAFKLFFNGLYLGALR